MRAPYIDGGDARLCTGCSACAFVCPTGAISMGEDSCGFVYPMVDEAKCVGCGKCLKACHMAAPDALKSESEPKAYGAYVRDRAQLMKSASGGVATAIAAHVVEGGGVAYGCVANREVVRHERLATLENIESSCGSRYVQSDISGAIPQIAGDLKAGTDVAFIGTPCQCTALKKLFGGVGSLLLVDLVCEGVPPQRMYSDFLDSLENELGERVSDFRFRDKRMGWGTKNPTVVMGDGLPAPRQRRSSDYPYYWLFQKGLILRDSCYACPYACENRVGDITVGDFWGAESAGLDYGLDELRDGISCVLVDTAAGSAVLSAIDDALVLKEATIDLVAQNNACLRRPSSCDVSVREEILDSYRSEGCAGLKAEYGRMFGPLQRILSAISSATSLAFRVTVKRFLAGLRKRVIARDKAQKLPVHRECCVALRKEQGVRSPNNFSEKQLLDCIDMNGTKSPELRYSIIMAMFNAEKTIGKAIESVQAQSFGNWELIIVNDGSTDASLDFAQKYLQSDERIRVFDQSHSGPGAARNLALHFCSGEYIAILDSDDYWEMDFLESIDAVALSENSDVLYFERIIEHEDGSYAGRSWVSRNKGLPKDAILERQMTGLVPWGFGKVFRRCLLGGINARYSNLEVGEEAILSFDIVSAAHTISFVSKPIYHYVKSRNGQHKKGGNDPWSPVVLAMMAHLRSIGEYEKYESTINSFALRALCISVYRTACCEDSLITATRNVEDKFAQYREQYDLSKLNDRAIDLSSKAIYILLKSNLSFMVVLVSRLRQKWFSN